MPFESELLLWIRGALRIPTFVMNSLKYIDKINERFAPPFAWLAIVLAITTFYDVIARYLFNAPTFWAYETGWMLYSAVWLVGIAYCHTKKQHVRVDVLFNRLPLRVRARVELFFYIIAFFPLCAVMIVCGTEFAWASWIIREGSTLTIWAPPAYPIKTLIPLAFILLALQGIAEFIRTGVTAVRGQQP